MRAQGRGKGHVPGDTYTAYDQAPRRRPPGTSFCVKEVDLGLAADVGTLQRLPRIIGSQTLVNDLCFTARRMDANEAVACGLCGLQHPSREAMIAAAVDYASLIASKSPVAVAVTKRALIFARDHPVDQGLDHIALWNAAALQSDDLEKLARAGRGKTVPRFARL